MKNKIKYILLFNLYIISGILHAQGPYNYETPLDKKIHHFSLYSTDLYTINPQEWGSAADGYNGLTIYINISLQKDDYKLFTFYNKYNELYLEIFKKGKTLLFRRYNPNIKSAYYDYILYDPLFVSSNIMNIPVWDIKLYFTGFFFWAQVSSGVASENYLSPVYFGVNALHRLNMEDYISAEAKSKIIVGDSRYSEKCISLVEIYAFHYDELVKDIDAKFSWPGKWGLYDFGSDPNEDKY